MYTGNLLTTGKEVKIVSDKELVNTTVSRYMDLLRIEKAEDYKREVANQKQELRVILESMGIAVDDLKII